jgi:hypothetical protein
MQCVGCGAELKPTPAEQREINARLVAAEHSKMINQIRAMTYREACRFADTPERARMVAAVKGFKPGWVFHHLRERRFAGGAA